MHPTTITRILLSATPLTLAAPTLAHAAADIAPPIVISATRIPTDASRIGSSVTVLDRAEIERKQKPTVIELLRDVPGVSVAGSGPQGQTSRVFLRGAESRHTLVIIDGMVVNDPADVGNAFDFAYLSTDNIERVEVLRGPQSTLYGSDAIGGVILINTRKGAGKKSSSRVAAEGGSHNTYRVSAGHGGSLERFDYNLDVSRFRTGGISAFNEKRGGVDEDGSDINTFSGSARAQVADNASVSLVGRAVDGYAEFDDFGFDALNHTSSREYNTRLSGDLSMMEGRWKQELGISNYLIMRDSVSTFGDPKYRGERQKADWVHTLKINDEHTGTLGLETSREGFKTDSVDSKSTNTQSVFVQDQVAINNRFFVAVGGRVDNHSTFGSEATWRIAPAYLIESTDTRLKASAGTGFKAPSLFQLYSAFGNPALNPEESIGYDVGFEQALWGDSLSFGATAFYNDIDNLIDYDFATNKYLNVGKARTRGVESFIALRPLPDLTMKLNHTYTSAEDRNTGQQLLRRPKHQFSAEVDKTFMDGKADVGVLWRHVGVRRDIDLAFSRANNPTYSTLELNGSYQIMEGVTLTGRIENALNREYEEVYGYGTPGRSAYISVRSEF